MDRRRLALGVAVWVAVVSVVSVATWTVIDAAGRGVTARPASDPRAGQAQVTTSVPSPQRTESPTRLRTRPPSPSPTRSPVTGPTSVQPPTTPAPSSAPTSNRPPAVTPREGTWTGSAGTVTTRCVGSRISLVSASPGDGWRMEVDDRGPGRVRVELTSGDDGERREVEVRAECLGGSPRYRVDT